MGSEGGFPMFSKEIHEVYKKTLRGMLLDFALSWYEYQYSTNEDCLTTEILCEFIERWVEEHIMEPYGRKFREVGRGADSAREEVGEIRGDVSGGDGGV